MTFATSAIAPNVERMPSRLIASMPLSILALVAAPLDRDSGEDELATETSDSARDGAVALVLAVGWLAMWALYLAYTWTVAATLGPSNPVHVIRFYLPALGLLALLAAWFVMRLPRWSRGRCRSSSSSASVFGITSRPRTTPSSTLRRRARSPVAASPRSVTRAAVGLADDRSRYDRLFVNVRRSIVARR